MKTSKHALLLGTTTLEPQFVLMISGTEGVRITRDTLKDEMHLRYSFGDHLSSVGGEADEQGSITSREEYYCYGGSAGVDDEAEEIFDRTRCYSGKERDASGLLYYGWRYYQPGVGCWLSADPGGLIDGLNLFRFTQNNPVNIVDTDGRGCISSKAAIEDPLVKSLNHARANFNKNISPGGIQHFSDKFNMSELVESENHRQGNNDSRAPESIKYYSDVQSFVSGLLEDHTNSESIHYQAIVHMVPSSGELGHFTAFDVYKPENARRTTLINVESAAGTRVNERGRVVPKGTGGVGLGLRDLYRAVDSKIPDIMKRPLILYYETDAQKSESDCGIFSIANARIMSQFPEKFIEKHKVFSEKISKPNTLPEFITDGSISKLMEISPKFFKYTHSNTVLSSLAIYDPNSHSGEDYKTRNVEKNLRRTRKNISMNVGIEQKRINFLQHAVSYFNH